MRTTMNVSLPRELKRWLDQQVKAGGYGTASEYLRDLLRRAQQRDARRKVDAMLIEAVESGATTVMDDADFTAIRKAARASAPTASGVKGMTLTVIGSPLVSAEAERTSFCAGLGRPATRKSNSSSRGASPGREYSSHIRYFPP